MADCERSDGFSFSCLCIADESFTWWLPGSRSRAERRGRSKVARCAARQARQLNQELDQWIRRMTCDEPCGKVVIRRVPATLPAAVTVQRYRKFLQVVAKLEARADVGCVPPTT